MIYREENPTKHQGPGLNLQFIRTSRKEEALLHVWFCLVISIQNLYKPGLSAFPKNSRQKQHNVCFHKGVEVLLEHVGLIYGVLELYTPVISPSRIQAKLP